MGNRSPLTPQPAGPGPSERFTKRPGSPTVPTTLPDRSIHDRRAIGATSRLSGDTQRFAQRERPVRQPRRQRLAFEVLHNEEVNVPLAPDIMERTDIGMTELRDGSRLAVEPLADSGAPDSSEGRTLMATDRLRRVSSADKPRPCHPRRLMTGSRRARGGYPRSAALRTLRIIPPQSFPRAASRLDGPNGSATLASAQHSKSCKRRTPDNQGR